MADLRKDGQHCLRRRFHAARRIAVRLGMAVVGTVGILERAAAEGLLDLAVAFDRLKQTDFQVSPPCSTRLWSNTVHEARASRSSAAHHRSWRRPATVAQAGCGDDGWPARRASVTLL